MILTFESVDEILWYDHSNETSSILLSHDMHQSIPAVPVPPGVGHLPTPGTTPGHLTSLSGFGLACNIWILKLSKMITFVKIFYNFDRLINTDNAFSVPR